MKTNPMRKLLIAVRSTISAHHGNEYGFSAMQGALLAVVLVSSALAFAYHEQFHQKSTVDVANLGANEFKNLMIGEYKLMKANMVADEQIAINAAENGESFNQCAETGCATQYNDGSNQNVPDNPSGLALTYANAKAAGDIGLSYVQDNIQNYQPPVFGGLMPVWNSTGGGVSYMENNSPRGFWALFAGTPTYMAFSLNDFFSWKQDLEGPNFQEIFGGLPQENLYIGNISNIKNVNTSTGTGFTASLSGGTPYVLTMGQQLALPITGDPLGGNLMLPSFYGLDPSVANDWKQTEPLTEVGDDNGEQVDDRQLLMPLPTATTESAQLKSVGVPSGYFIPAATFPLTAVPAGLALNQWTVSTPGYCEYGGNLINYTVYQTQTNGAGGTQQVQVNSYSTGGCNPPPSTPPPSTTPSTASNLVDGLANGQCRSNGVTQFCNDDGNIVANIGTGAGAVYGPVSCNDDDTDCTADIDDEESSLTYDIATDTSDLHTTSDNGGFSGNAQFNGSGNPIAGYNNNGGLIQGHTNSPGQSNQVNLPPQTENQGESQQESPGSGIGDGDGGV